MDGQLNESESKELPAALEAEIGSLTTSIFVVMSQIVGSQISPDHIHDLIRLKEADEDSANPSVDRIARECALGTLQDLRLHPTIKELEDFFAEITPIFGSIFRIYYDAAPDREIMQAKTVLEHDPSNLLYRDKISRAIAYGHLADFFSTHIAEQPGLVELLPGDDPEDVFTRIGTYMAELALHLVQKPEEIPEMAI